MITHAIAIILFAGGVEGQHGTCDLDNARFRSCLYAHASELVKKPEPVAHHVVVHADGKVELVP